MIITKEKLLSINLKRDELERSIGGGLPANSTVLIEGPDGAGKSLVAQRFTYALLENNLKVSYISTELNTQGFIEQMSSLDYDVKYHVLDDKMLFISLFPYYGHGQLRQNFLDILLQSKKIFSSDVIVFDTLSFLLVDDQLSQDDAFAFLQFLKRLNNLGKTVIMCVDPDQVNQKLLTLIRSSCDAMLDIEIKTFAGALMRVINVKRFKRSGGDVLSSIPFRVEPGKGLVIEIASFS